MPKHSYSFTTDEAEAYATMLTAGEADDPNGWIYEAIEIRPGISRIDVYDEKRGYLGAFRKDAPGLTACALFRHLKAERARQ